MFRGLQLGLVVLSLGFGTFLGRAAQSPALEGQPTQLRQGALVSYWVWHDDDGYHVRTTTAHDRRIFSGHIEISRGDAWVKSYQLRADDVVRLTGNRIEFRLVNQKNLSGFDLRLDWSGEATLYLEIDGQRVKSILDKIFVGRENSHLTSDPIPLTGSSRF